MIEISITPHDLPLPQALLDLIESGFWPLTLQASNAQNLKSLVSLDKIKAFAPEEQDICFYRPPFGTEAQFLANHNFAHLAMWCTKEIDPALTLIIGDFGLGSDAPIALDYRANFDDPLVIRLKWGEPYTRTFENNHWVEIAPSFAEFAKMILD